MNTPIIPSFVAALLAATSFAFGASNPFEGKVTYDLTTERGPVKMTYYLKDHLARTEISMDAEHSAVMLMNFSTHEMTMMIPGQKMYLVRPLPAAEPSGTESTPSERPAVDFQRTGQFETILGRKCEKIVIKSHDGTAEVWGAEGMGVFMNPGMGGAFGRRLANPQNAWESELMRHGFFPLRVVARDADGHQTAKLEATEIDASPLPDSLFAPPADYHKFEMPAVPGMGGMNPLQR